MSDGKNMLETFRDVAQDLLVPELKAVKMSVDALRTEMKMNNDSVREEIRLNAQLLREEMKFRHEALSQDIRHLSDRLEEQMHTRERLATIEARLSKQ